MASNVLPSALSGRRLPNVWDVAALLFVVGAIVAVANVARGTLVPLDALQATPIDLDPAALPGYALRTTVRMFAALFASILFTFAFAPLAAKNRRAGRIMIPVLD